MATSLHWKRALLIPCAALAAAALQPGASLADPEPSDRFGGRGPGVNLSESQKEQLFQTRRKWELRSYDKRLALLRVEQRCLERARTVDAFRGCKQQQHQARRALHEQGRQVMNAERRRLGLKPLLERRGPNGAESQQQKGRSWWNGPQGS